MRILYTRIVLRISLIHRGRIILFSKGCPNPSTSSLPLRRQLLPLPAGNRPAKGQPPLRLVPPPLVATRLAAGSSPLRVPCSRPPLRALRCKRLPPLWASHSRSCPSAATAPVGGASARKRRPLRSPLASLSGWPWPHPVGPL
ncbi:hypothetical protein BHM03_00061778 [Ensete ventricosum]|nr:hypothetical protein BHM03_00061778 [Ensete ventricosum]